MAIAMVTVMVTVCHQQLATFISSWQTLKVMAITMAMVTATVTVCHHKLVSFIPSWQPLTVRATATAVVIATITVTDNFRPRCTTSN